MGVQPMPGVREIAPAHSSFVGGTGVAATQMAKSLRVVVAVPRAELYTRTR